jgi:glutaredoxin-like protein
MALLSDSDRIVVRDQLKVVSHRVTLLFFTQAIGAPETALIAKQVLDEVASLNDAIDVEEVNFVLDKDRAAQFGITDIPGVALLRDGEDTRMRFLGAPSGYEFMSLVQAVVLAGTGDSGLSPNSKAEISSRVTEKTELMVFVTPTCPHCPRAVNLAHRMAVESPLITATCVEATEFPELSRRYRVTGVPKTVATVIARGDLSSSPLEILGAVPEDQFVSSLVPAAPSDRPV